MEDKQKLCDKYVNWQAFIWAIGLITIFMMAVIGVAMNAKAESSQALQKLETYKNDIEWIKSALAEIKTDIKEIKQ